MARLKDSRPKGENDTKRETPIVQFPLNQETACELFAPDAKAALEKVAKEDTSASYTRTDSNTVCLRQPRSEGDGISWARPIWIARQINRAAKVPARRTVASDMPNSSATASVVVAVRALGVQRKSARTLPLPRPRKSLVGRSTRTNAPVHVPWRKRNAPRAKPQGT